MARVVWVEDGGGDERRMTTIPQPPRGVEQSGKSSWRAVGFFVASAILGFISGSLIAMIPGMAAYRSDPSRVVLWMRIDQFLAVMALSCGLASAIIFRFIARPSSPTLLPGVALLGEVPWVLIALGTAEAGWFRTGGSLVGLAAALVLTGVSCLLWPVRSSQASP